MIEGFHLIQAGQAQYDLTVPGHAAADQAGVPPCGTTARRRQCTGPARPHTFGDAKSFLEEFFPGRADELRQYQDGPWLL